MPEWLRTALGLPASVAAAAVVTVLSVLLLVVVAVVVGTRILKGVTR